MLGMYFLISLTTVSVALQSSVLAAEVMQDRLTGAVLASVIGDALGRPTSYLDTTYEIQSIYPGNLDSFKKFTDVDWVMDDSNKKMAAYTDNTVLSALVLESCIEGRRLNQSKEAIADIIARKLVDLYGPHKRKLDPLFDVRSHLNINLENAELLSERLESKKKENWWNTLPQDVDTKFHKELSTESDAGAIMRAWPIGLVFNDNFALIKEYADYQTAITHRHPTARAAAAALAIGIAYSLQGAAVEDIVNQMVRAAERYDLAERLYKHGSKKIRTRSGYTQELISKGQMFTSDMIRYAYLKAKEGESPLDICGDTSKRQDNNRSYRGYLLGYEADEAVAAAVYTFVRHADDVKGAITEAVNIPGNSALVASLVGALVGARVGFATVEQAYKDEIGFIENAKNHKASASELAVIINKEPVTEEVTISSSNRFLKWAVILGVGAVACYGIYKCFFEKKKVV